MSIIKLSNNTNVLNIITRDTAIKRANEKIKESMLCDNPGLLSRWWILNKHLGGCFRFNNIITIAGASTHGKSFFLNMIREDFCSVFNTEFPHEFKILSFCFEMSAEDEIIRTYSSILETSYSTIVSANKKIDSDFYDSILEKSQDINNDICYYIEESGTIKQIEETVDYFHTQYPDIKLVVTLDHTLLAEYEQGSSDEVKLVSSLYKMAIRIKKRYGDMIIFLGQLNDGIEKPERRNPDNTHLHYPTKTDLFSSKQAFHDSDQILICNMPDKYHLKYYGTDGYSTFKLFVVHKIKDRLFGGEGIIRFLEDFAHGTLHYPYDSKGENEWYYPGIDRPTKLPHKMQVNKTEEKEPF